MALVVVDALTVGQLGVALKLITDDANVPAALAPVLTRELATACALVDQYVDDDCPVAVKNEAVIRICGWLTDSPPERSEGRNPLLSSGASALLRAWRTPKAVS